MLDAVMVLGHSCRSRCGEQHRTDILSTMHICISMQVRICSIMQTQVLTDCSQTVLSRV